MERDVEALRESWKRATDKDVIEAAARAWGEYPECVKDIIEAEARDRDLWRKALWLRGETREGPFCSDACPACKGTEFNLETGRCVQCGLPATDIAYCSTCNKFFSEFTADLACPNDGASLAVGCRAASQGIRIANYVVDRGLILLFSSAVSMWLFADGQTLGPIFFSVQFLYYLVFESLLQRTPGKLLTGTKVIDSTGKRPTVATAFARTIIRFVPFDEISFLGDRVYGWHDKWSKTCVVRTQAAGIAKKSWTGVSKGPPIYQNSMPALPTSVSH
jgi:hypothetical protein